VAFFSAAAITRRASSKVIIEGLSNLGFSGAETAWIVWSGKNEVK